MKKRRFSEEYKIGYDFGLKTYKKFKDIIKSIVLFNKTNLLNPKYVNVFIIIDDCTVDWDPELTIWYREELKKLIQRQPYSKKLSIQTITLSSFWEELRTGEPAVINLIRFGQPLIDVAGFFEPLKILLARGRIRPSPEAVYLALKRATNNIFKANNNLLLSIEGMLWAMIDSSHAVLMAINQTPVSAEHIPMMLTEHFVKTKKLDKKYIEYYNEVKNTSDKITQGKIIRIKGKDIDNLFEKTEKFVRMFRQLGEQLIKEQKIIKEKRI